LVGAGAETGVIGAQSVLAGDAGSMNISATGTISIQNGFRITSSTVGSGSGGSVTVTAGKAITFDGADSRINSLTVPQLEDAQNELFVRNWGVDFDTIRAELAALGYPPDADLFTVLGAMNDLSWTQIPGELKPGAGGRVTVNAPVLTLNAGTRVETSTGWDGNAGLVQANVGSLLLNAGGALKSTSGFQHLTGEAVIGAGSAGAIEVNATDTITVTGQGTTISTTTFGEGGGGNIALNAGNQVSILSGGRVVGESGGIIGGGIAVGSGSGGSVQPGIHHNVRRWRGWWGCPDRRPGQRTKRRQGHLRERRIAWRCGDRRHWRRRPGGDLW
jgi:large exoprotein involved in heme utilization and adhesion